MENTPYFHALAAFSCQANRLYRIYIRPHGLIFIWAGKGAEGLMGSRLMSQAPGGALISSIGEALFDPSAGNEERREVLDHTPLNLLLGDHPKNFRAALFEFEAVRIGPRSENIARFFGDHEHQAMLYVRLQTRGKFRLGIASVKDTQVALQELPRLFGAKCRIDIPWPDREQPCLCTLCRSARRQARRYSGPE